MLLSPNAHGLLVLDLAAIVYPLGRLSHSPSIDLVECGAVGELLIKNLWRCVCPGAS